MSFISFLIAVALIMVAVGALVALFDGPKGDLVESSTYSPKEDIKPWVNTGVHYASKCVCFFLGQGHDLGTWIKESIKQPKGKE